MGWVLTFEPGRTVWANAQVLESANAEASAIAVSFMVVSVFVYIRDNRTIANKTFVSCRCGRRCHSEAELAARRLSSRGADGSRRQVARVLEN